MTSPKSLRLIAKDLFLNIISICAEGSTAHTEAELLDMVCDTAMRGYDLCRKTGTALDCPVNCPHLIIDRYFGRCGCRLSLIKGANITEEMGGREFPE